MGDEINTFSESTTQDKNLTSKEKTQLELQNSRLVSDYIAKKVNSESKKHWDLFYKRNDVRFFKDRHWTLREFKEILDIPINSRSNLLEIGCGVGNFIYPLIEENLNLFIYACDLSSRAIELVKSNPLYSENKIKAFQTDITTEDILNEVPEESVDIITLIFVLSSIDPTNHPKVARTLYQLLKPNGYVLFRDYGLYDMAQVRFKPGHKISENFYMRQDGTRSYFFSLEFLGKLFEDAGFEVLNNCYVNRRTVNIKEGIDVPRIFVQSKFKKPADTPKSLS